MNEYRPTATVSPGSCSYCGKPLSGDPTGGGLCLRCAGVRVLEIEAVFGSAENGPRRAESRGETMQRIGPYEIIEELGRGGMGRVFAARQVGLGRIVALKTIAVGPSAPSELEMRFLREAQTIARLRHPNIVAVHDFGRADGCVYFSMDYIEGGDLAVKSRGGGTPFFEAATLMRKIAEALAYAHAQGILHRDLKPSNILMDGSEPKLADFGLAAQLEAGGDLTRATSVLGTPHYLAPEAITGGSAALTVASDLYAAGIVLFHLLTGRTPFAGASPAELPSLSANTEPPSPRLIAPAVPSDLETICLKCIEPDPARRYGSASALAEDLGRFIEGKPVRAQPPSALYLFRKFARRHRVPLAAGLLVVLTLVAATVESLWLAFRATNAERRAASEAAASKEVTNFLENDLLAQASPDNQPNRNLPLRTVLDRAADKIEERFRTQPLVASSLHATVSATYASLGEYGAAKKHAERALELRRQAIGRTDPEAESLMDALAVILNEMGNSRDAEALELETIRLLEKDVGPESLVTIRSLENLVAIYQQEGKLGEAESAASKALGVCRKNLEPESQEYRDALINLSSIYFSEGKLKDAETLNKQAVDLQIRVLGPEHPDTLVAMSNLASVYYAEGNLDESVKENLEILRIRRRVLGPGHPDTLRSMHNLATTYMEEGRMDEAAEIENQALDGRRKAFGPEHFDTLSSMNALVSIYMSQNKLAEAEALGSKAYASAVRGLGAEHYLTLRLAGNLANIYRRQGRFAEAEPIFTRTLAAFQRTLGFKNPLVFPVMDNHGEALLERGDYDGAERAFRQVLALRVESSPNEWRTYASQSGLAAALTGLKRYSEAEPLLLEAEAGLQRSAGRPTSGAADAVSLARQRLVRLYEEWGRPASAETWRVRQK